jgi:hypothetical protein
MRPFRHYDPQGPGQQDSETIVHLRSLSPLVPLGLTPNDPIGGLGGTARALAYDQLYASESTRKVHLPFCRTPRPKLTHSLHCLSRRLLLISGIPLPVVL